MAAGKNGVSMKWDGMDKAMLAALQSLTDTKELLATIGEALVSSTKKRFDDEESPSGQNWTPSKRAMASEGKTLTDTGRLRRSIDYATTADRVMVGSNVVYARIHQLGGKAGRGRKVKMEARPYLGFSDADKDEVKGTIADFIATAFKKKG